MLRRLYRWGRVRAERARSHPNRLMRGFARVVLMTLPTLNASRFVCRKLRRGVDAFWSIVAGTPAAKHVGLEYVLSHNSLFWSVKYTARICVLLIAAAAKACEIIDWDDRTFVLRVSGPIDQVLLRNLLLWQDQILCSYPGLVDGWPFDVIFLIDGPTDNPRYFDLFSAALMLERVRNVTLVDCEETIDNAAPVLLTLKEEARWREKRCAGDLRQLPEATGGQVGRRVTSRGLKLLQGGRKRAHDFFKLAMPDKIVVAVGLRERGDGDVEQDQLDRCLSLIEAAGARHLELAFVILNRVAPTQRRVWPAHVHFARHAGMSLQDTISLAMVADGYFGVLDLLGFAAFSAARPGVYVPLTPEDIVCGGGATQADQQIIPHGCDPAALRRAFDTFVARFSDPTSPIRSV
jgi:hypothetical protein